jgi:signal transduction histidine kinase
LSVQPGREIESLMGRRQPFSGLGGRIVIPLLVCLLAPPVAAWAQPQKQVLALYSTRRDAQIVTIGDRELPRILEQGLGGVDYYAEYIDETRFSDPAYQAALRDFLRLKYSGVRIDAVIALEARAITIVSQAPTPLFPGSPIVFFASSPVPSVANATGVVAPLDLADTMEFIGELQPEVRHIFVVAGATPADKGYETLARSQFRPFESRFTFTYLTALPTRELESRLASLPDDSAIYYLIVNRDGDGDNVHPVGYIDRLAAIANAPMYCWVDSAMNHGIVGGSLKDQTAQLEAVGRLTVRVLSGESADSIPVSSLNLNVRQVDWRQLRRWGISESAVPEGARLLFKEPTVWERYKVYVLGTIAVLLAQTFLIVGLLVQRRRRRLAEDQARGSQEALQGSYERIRDLGSRLLRAQDTERSRLARELHDDISQQVALLSADLELLLGGEVAPDNEVVLGEAWNRTQDIAISLHDLSHRLHPAKLRLIGLVAGLRSLQREMSHSDLKVTFTHDNVQASLPPELTVSLFRIAQEALQNAVKHSNAETVRIHLQGGSTDLVLTVSDDGAGFDVDSEWGKGLGLISIGERAETVGATFTVRSQPGAGTSLTVHVPVGVEQASGAAAAGQVV